MAPPRPVPPPWSQLPRPVQFDLGNRPGCRDYYEQGTPAERLFLLNGRAALIQKNLWNQMAECAPRDRVPRDQGMFFKPRDMNALKQELRRHSDMTNPWRTPFQWFSSTLWDSRDKTRNLGQVHLKQFAGPTQDYIQVHVDVQGFSRFNPAQWWRHAYRNPWADPWAAHGTLSKLPERIELPPVKLDWNQWQPIVPDWAR